MKWSFTETFFPSISSCVCLTCPTQQYRFGVISAILHEVYVSSLLLQLYVWVPAWVGCSPDIQVAPENRNAWPTNGYHVTAMSVHKPFIWKISPVVLVKWKCCAWTYISGGQVSCCARSTTTLDLPSFFLTRGSDAWVFAAQKWPCPLSMRYLQHYTTQRLYCDFIVWTERNLHMSGSLRMTHLKKYSASGMIVCRNSCKPLHKLKTLSNYAHTKIFQIIACMVLL